MCGLGQRSWYSDSLHTGLTGDWILACTRFSAALQASLGTTQYNGYLISFLGLSDQGVALNTHTHLAPKWKSVCVWLFDLKSKRWTQMMQYVTCHFSHCLLLSPLPVNHTACIGTLTHYKLDCLGFESRLALDFLQLSRPALGPTQYNGYLISFHR